MAGFAAYVPTPSGTPRTDGRRGQVGGDAPKVSPVPLPPAIVQDYSVMLLSKCGW